MPTPTDPQSLAVASVHRLLADLVASGVDPCTLVADASAHGWSISLVVGPTAGSPGSMSRCKRDALSVLSPSVRLTSPAVLAALESRGLEHGERTVRGVLAELVRDGIILSSRTAPRGYYLPSPGTSQASA